jgi:hypothetical protein
MGRCWTRPLAASTRSSSTYPASRRKVTSCCSASRVPSRAGTWRVAATRGGRRRRCTCGLRTLQRKFLPQMVAPCFGSAVEKLLPAPSLQAVRRRADEHTLDPRLWAADAHALVGAHDAKASAAVRRRPNSNSWMIVLTMSELTLSSSRNTTLRVAYIQTKMT